MNSIRQPILFPILIGFFVTATASAQEIIGDEAKPDELTYLNEFKHEGFQRPASVAVSQDGTYIYGAGYGAPSVLVVKHNRESDTLEFVQLLSDDRLSGTVSLRLSNNDRFAAVATFGRDAVSLLARNEETGELTIVDTKSATSDPNITGMNFASEAGFSHDDRFVNVLDDTGGVTVFRVVDDSADNVVGEREQPQLEFVQAFRSDDLDGARGLAHHAHAPFLFVSCKRANCIVALEQDADRGTLEIVDIKGRDQDGIRGLEKAFGVTTSQTGDFVYSVSGHGNPRNNAVCVFQFDPFAKQLKLIQDAYPAEIELHGFTTTFHGGNEVRVNENHLYACATTSGTIAAFARNKISGKIKLTSIEADKSKHGWANGLAISPDGTYLYSACDNGKNSIGLIRLQP